jgi:cyclomaltodextrin glucanotransferase
MHSYWTKDFKRVNPHFVSEGESTFLKTCVTLRRMIEALHERDIKIVLDLSWISSATIALLSCMAAREL